MGPGREERLKKLAFGLLAIFLGILLMEGLSGFVLLAYDIITKSQRPLAERNHTRYDEVLGWVNIPNLHVRDMYGPDVYLRTNVQGFRNNEDIETQVPPGKMRILCSGDSFTLGYGVDNEHTWVHLLSLRNDRLQTVNMGQGGYGVDQAYLWYQRDGRKLHYDAHIFAFIPIDFDRMRNPSLLGYNKPILRLRGGDLAVEGVPVPRRAFYVPWLTQNAEIFGQVNLLRLLGRIARRAFPQGSPVSMILSEEQTRQVTARLFEKLQEENQQDGSTLVLVHLPTRQDYTSTRPNAWRRFVVETAEQRGINFVDLLEDFRKLSAAEVDSLFITRDLKGYPFAAGHYSVRGNEFIAGALYTRLMEIPEMARKPSGHSRLSF